MDKVLIGIPVIDRPKTTEKCFQQILKMGYRSHLTIVAIDNNSNEQTQDILYKYQKDLDIVIHNPFNVGVAFASNQAMALLQPGQHFLKVDVDAHIISDTWLDSMLTILHYPDTGVVLGRRPTFWYESDRINYLTSGHIKLARRDGMFLEIPSKGIGFVWPWGMIKSDVIEQIGYMNEAVNIDDMDYCIRLECLDLIAAYIPNVVILQEYHEPGHLNYEEQHHPQYGTFRKCIEKNRELFKEYQEEYQKGFIYCGTRFLPGSIGNELYQKQSDENWEFMTHYESGMDSSGK